MLTFRLLKNEDIFSIDKNNSGGLKRGTLIYFYERRV
jgi:hypothetical protein